MLYREIIAVCSEIRIKHINTLCGQNVEFVNVKTSRYMEGVPVFKGLNFKTKIKRNYIYIYVCVCVCVCPSPYRAVNTCHLLYK